MALLPCPNCGKQIGDKAVRCPSCGVSIEEVTSNTVLCSECKTRYAKDAEACPNCGCPNPGAIKECHPPRKSTKPGAIALLAGIAAFVVLVICYFLFWGSGARYNNALKKLNLEDYAAAQTMFEALDDYKDASDKAAYCKDMLEAISEFENGANELDQKNQKFFELIDSAELLLADGAPALESELFAKLESAISVAKATVYSRPERPSDKDSILALAEEMVAVDYSDAFPPLNDACNNLITSQKRYALVNHPTEEYIIQCLQKVPDVIDISAVTEETDPMDSLNKPGWYTAHVYFSHELVDQNDVYGNTLIEKGTDAGGSIEVYISAEEAANRNQYLAAFDGGVLASGSHTVVGTCVIRTSNELTATQQKTLEENIAAILTYIDGDNIEFADNPVEEPDYTPEPAPAPAPTPGPAPEPTPSRKEQAVSRAHELCDEYIGADRWWVYDWLTSVELFSEEEATYAVYHGQIDWKTEAVEWINFDEPGWLTSNKGRWITPNEFLNSATHQLTWDGFTSEEISYAIDNFSAVDWTSEAVNRAKMLVEDEPYTYDELVEFLQSEGFSREDAVTGAEMCGIDWSAQG